MENNLVFMGAETSYENSELVIFGAPMDTTVTNRPGTRFGPMQARLESYGLETYSPYMDKDLEGFKYCDLGDLELTFGNPNKQLSEIQSFYENQLENKKKMLMIGGEHLVSLAPLRALNKVYDDIHVIHLDAHCDLRKDYMGEELSHSTVMYHINKLDNVNKIWQFGIRSGTKEEFHFSKDVTYMEKFSVDTVEEIVSKLENKNVYISIDLDVLDPSVFSGTGTPEPGGITFKELNNAINKMSKLNNIIGMDVVELSPQLDQSGVSNAVCAKAIRELILITKGE